MPGKLTPHVVCPLCHRRQALRSGTSLPELWFDDRQDPALIDFMHFTRAYGGQGRGVKGKVKAISGWQLESTATLQAAYDSAEHHAKVEALYHSARHLVAYLESIGVR